MLIGLGVTVVDVEIDGAVGSDVFEGILGQVEELSIWSGVVVGTAGCGVGIGGIADGQVDAEVISAKGDAEVIGSDGVGVGSGEAVEGGKVEPRSEGG